MSSAVARWSAPVAGTVLVAAVGLVGLVLVRLDVIATRPWGYLALTAAIMGAVGGLILAVARARAIAEE